MHAAPNQHLLTLPSSPVGNSSDPHAGVQKFKSHSGHKFFFTYILSQPYFGQFFYLVCRYLEKKNNKHRMQNPRHVTNPKLIVSMHAQICQRILYV